MNSTRTGKPTFKKLFYDLSHGFPKRIRIRITIEKSGAYPNSALGRGFQRTVRQGRAMKARAHADPPPIQLCSKHVGGNARGSKKENISFRLWSKYRDSIDGR